MKGKANLKPLHFQWLPEIIQEFKIHGQYKERARSVRICSCFVTYCELTSHIIALFENLVASQFVNIVPVFCRIRNLMPATGSFWILPCYSTLSQTESSFFPGTLVTTQSSLIFRGGYFPRHPLKSENPQITDRPTKEILEYFNDVLYNNVF